jgi:hypothetical protein
MGNERKDGGPAFPRIAQRYIDQTNEYAYVQEQEGMSLRDYFAAKAMQGFAGAESASLPSVANIAEWAYSMADAMLEARKTGATP